MDIIVQALILAIIQGLTEFLPVSSSAHLILPSQLLGWPDQGQAFDVAVHLGTLMAVVTYFNHDIRRMLGGMAQAVLGNGARVIVRDAPDDTRTTAEIAVRPEALSLSREDAPAGDATAIPARVTHRTFLGDRTEYLLQADGIGSLQVNAPRQAARAVGEHDVGAMVHVLWPAGTGLVLAADT